MHYFLRQVLPPDSDPETPIEIQLYTDTIYVGRNQFKSLTRFPQVSRKHAVFFKTDDGNVFVKDLGSLNGVYVNDTRIGSYLKQLKPGDVIGFGVASSGAAEGFVCVLCSEDIDVEEIEITDDNDEDDRSTKKSNSKTGVNCDSSLNSTVGASHSNNNVYLPDIYERPSCSKHRNRTKNTRRKVERGESSSHARNGVNCDNSDSNLPESSNIRSVSLPQDGIENVRGEPTLGEAKFPERSLLRECFIRLVRCDDSSFQFPADVKNPFETEHIKPNLQRTKLTNQRDYSETIKRTSHRKRKQIRKRNTDSSDDSEEYIPQSATPDSSVDSDENMRVSAQSKAQRTRYPVNNKHRRKRSRKLSTYSSDDSGEYIRRISRPRAQHTTYSSINNKHRRQKSRKLSTESSEDSKYIGRSTQSKTHHATDLLSNKHPRKRPKILSSDSCDSDKNADLVSNKHERRRQRNSSSVSSDGSCKILYARASSKTCLKADTLTNDENGRDCRKNSANHVSGKNGAFPRDSDLKGSSSKKEGNLRAEAKISLGNQNEKEVRYSQADTFYISDDETYLDLKSPQVLVTQKPEEKGDSDSESDTCKEIFGREDSYSPTPNTAVWKGHPEDRIESIESIRAFIEGPKNTKSDSHACDRVVQINNSVFPLPSRDTDGEESPEYHSDASICSNEGDGSDQVRNSKGGERTSLLTKNNKGIRKSVGRTLLTEPKPLTYVPRKFRGRDENFVERKKPLTAPPPRVEKPSADGTPRSESKNSKSDDCNLPPPGKRRISHFASKASTSKSSGPSLTPNDSSHPAQPSSVVDVVGENRVGIERTKSSRRHDTVRLPPVENAVTRSSAAGNATACPPPAKNAATNHQHPVTVYDQQHERLPARLEGSNGILRKLLQMNTRWLQEQAKFREPPPDVSRGAAPLPPSFDSHESYTAMFSPLIVLEMWERLYTEWRDVDVNEGRNCKFNFVVLGHTERGGCVELECESLSADGRPGPRLGDVAVLDVKEGLPNNQRTSFFGYVMGHSMKLLGTDYVLGDTPWKQLPEDWRSGGDDPKLWMFRACVKRKRETPSFDQHSLMTGYNLGSVGKLLAWADALYSVRDSPLLDTLLRPTTYTMSTFQRQTKFEQQSMFYTSEQEGFIRKVSDAVVRRTTDPEVFLLGGGPGTGKTHVIVGLVERLLYRRVAGDIRVLVAAPADTAIDEIGRRLIKLGRKYEGNSVRFVRLGNERQVDRLLAPYCVSKVVRGLSVDEAEVLRRSHVVLSTLSGLYATHKFRPSLCIVDDASQCTEPEALQSVVTGAALLVLAGDPSQRAPNIVSRVARHFGLGRSLFERVMLSRPAHALCEQFRMHPEIARYPCPSSFASTRRPVGLPSPLLPYLVLDLANDEDPRPVEVVCDFVCSADPLAAVAALVAPSSRRARFRAEASPLRRHARRIEVRSPDGFLGREKDVVVLWAALTCPMRLRAALTRARRCLIVCVAGQKMARAYPMWAEFLADAEERGVLCTAPPSTDHLRKVLRRRLLVQPR